MNFYLKFFAKISVLMFSGVYSFAPLGLLLKGFYDFLLPIEAILGVIVALSCFVWIGKITYEVLKCPM